MKSAEELANYLTHFRADNIVHDSEFIRKCIVPDSGRWTVLGQVNMYFLLNSVCISMIRSTNMGFLLHHVIIASLLWQSVWEVLFFFRILFFSSTNTHKCLQSFHSFTSLEKLPAVFLHMMVIVI